MKSTKIEKEADENPFLSSVFSETPDFYSLYDNYFLGPLDPIDVPEEELGEDDGNYPLLNMFQAFDRAIVPSNKGQILETSFRRDGASSIEKYHPLRPAVFTGIRNVDRVIICGTRGPSLNVVFTDLSRGRATFQDKRKTPVRKGGVVTDMVPLMQSTKNKGTILISESDRLGILSVEWELNDSSKLSKKYDTTVVEVVPSSKCPVVLSGRIREIDVNRKCDRAVIAGHSDHVQVVDLHKWQSVTKTKSFGVVGSVRWKDEGSNILTWTTDQGYLVLYDPRISSAMCSRYPFAPWSSGSLPYTHDNVPGKRDAVMIGYSDGYVDALDLRNGLSKPKLIFRSRVPALERVGDIRAGSHVCVAYGETRIRAENESSAESRMGLLHHSIEDGMVLCPPIGPEIDDSSGLQWSSSSDVDSTFVTSSTTIHHRGRTKKGTRTRMSRGSFFDNENRVAVSDNMGHLWIVNV